MKAQLFDSKGEKKSDFDLPPVFNTPIREDLISKLFEIISLNERQKFSTFKEAGKRHSASGTISHQRHKWASHYGKGIARLPRKTMWRRGTQFYWIGAEVSGTRGGRVAHPPKGILKDKKMNEKEMKFAMRSAIAATAQKELIARRYSSLAKVETASPVIESLPSKTKEFIETLNKIFGKSFSVVLKQKQVRPGKGKIRGRRYKSNAGLLLVKGSKEKSKFKGVKVSSVKDLSIKDLYPLGRITLYTKQAMEELKNA